MPWLKRMDAACLSAAKGPVDWEPHAENPSGKSMGDFARSRVLGDAVA
jgi:hypothetical protein